LHLLFQPSQLASPNDQAVVDQPARRWRGGDRFDAQAREK
jgi:hypothetical protein